MSTQLTELPIETPNPTVGLQVARPDEATMDVELGARQVKCTLARRRHLIGLESICELTGRIQA